MAYEFKPVHAVIALAIGALLALLNRSESPALEPSRTDEGLPAPIDASAAKRVATTVEVIRVVERPRRKRAARKAVQPAVTVEPVAEPVVTPAVDPNPNPES